MLYEVITDTLEELPKQEKEYDTILFLVKNQDRANKVEFGIPFLSYPMMIITNVDGSYIGKTSDLNGKKVAFRITSYNVCYTKLLRCFLCIKFHLYFLSFFSFPR